MTTLMALDVADRAVLVAGGGPVAARRAASLVEDGARVTVVAPQLCEELIDLVQRGRLTWADREAVETDLDGIWFVHAATDDAQVNARLCLWATHRRVWSVCASASELGTARTPAVTSHAGLRVGVASQDAADPGRVAAVRDQLADLLATGPIDLRRRRPRGHSGDTGRVVLVGGGPGAPDLITVRGRRVLFEADVVVADRLGPTSLLSELAGDVEMIDVGKAPGRYAAGQDEINRILVEQAQRGRLVVRLKGGDPFVFGRGGEEVLALAEYGIPVEVVPGVSSALAAPLAAGIPLTHRGTVSALHVAHGHDPLDEHAVAAVVGGDATLILLMGVARLPDHVERLLAAGADPSVPVAVIQDATLPTQRVTRATLGAIVDAAASRRVRAPAVIVVGAVAAADLLGECP